ncbi:metallophosphoesterase [Streptomyces tricolor]|nr:metallophosphoesterase [Streptomyces tricolor]
MSATTAGTPPRPPTARPSPPSAPRPRVRSASCSRPSATQGVGRAAQADDGLLLRQRPAFHLHAGDICYADASGTGRPTDGYDPASWDLFLKQNEPVARSVPWMVTTGNHDMEAWYSPDGYSGQLAQFSLPETGFDPHGTPGAYAFTYGNAGFVAFGRQRRVVRDPRQPRQQRRPADGLAGPDSLRRLRADDGIDFVVVFFHHCAYSTSQHASDGGVHRGGCRCSRSTRWTW